MARIPEAEIERLKNELAVERLVEAAGLELKKSGKDWIGRCLFHEDDTASCRAGASASPNRRSSPSRPDAAAPALRCRVATELRENFFVLTGASGSGKSSIIAALKARGHCCVEEIGRRVVREQLAGGGDGTPWQNHRRFMALLLAGAVTAFRSVAEHERPVFFDRGIPEGLGHARSLPRAEREAFVEAAATCRYNRTVFVTPPWPEIYTTDDERRHSYEQVLAMYRAETASYVEAGYELVVLEKAPVEARVDRLLELVGERLGR